MNKYTVAVHKHCQHCSRTVAACKVHCQQNCSCIPHTEPKRQNNVVLSAECNLLVKCCSYQLTVTLIRTLHCLIAKYIQQICLHQLLLVLTIFHCNTKLPTRCRPLEVFFHQGMSTYKDRSSLQAQKQLILSKTCNPLWNTHSTSPLWQTWGGIQRTWDLQVFPPPS